VQCNKQADTHCYQPSDMSAAQEVLRHAEECGGQAAWQKGPTTCRTSQTWKRLTTEAKERCHSSERNQELQNLAQNKTKKQTNKKGRIPNAKTALVSQGTALKLLETNSPAK